MMKLQIKQFRIVPNSPIALDKISTKPTVATDKKEAKKELKANRKELSKLQEKFWADNRHSLLIIFQAPDAAGKDGSIRHVMSGINPQGCRVHSYKAPSKEELDHGYLWRHFQDLPERGMIEIFNRSHYENILATKVNKKYLLNEHLPQYDEIDKIDHHFWEKRYQQINNFEQYLVENGMVVLKFFLHLSKDEQKRRFLDRLNKPEKKWKFSSADLQARTQWEEYQKAYEEMIENTTTDYAPWYIIPADDKPFARTAIGEIIVETLENLHLKFPSPESPELLEKAKKILESEI